MKGKKGSTKKSLSRKSTKSAATKRPSKNSPAKDSRDEKGTEAPDVPIDERLFSMHNIPPPVVFRDGSLTVESKHDFTETTLGSGRRYRKGPVGNATAVKLHHLKILHGNGDIIYQNSVPTGCRIDLWVAESPSGNPHLNIKEEGVYFQIDSDKRLPKTTHPNLKRQNKYEHPGPTAAKFRVTRIKVSKMEMAQEKVLFEVTAPSGTESEEYCIFLWLEGAE